MSLQYFELSYPNFVLGTIIDPDEANQNNHEIVEQINNLIDVNNTNITSITDLDLNKADKTQIVEIKNLLNSHKTSSDHDSIYYTKNAANAITDAIAVRLNDGLIELRDHKVGTDHNSIYYTKQQIDDLVFGVSNNLNNHKSSNDHDARYVTKNVYVEDINNLVPISSIGVSNGVAPLNSSGKVDKSFIDRRLDNIVYHYNSSSFPNPPLDDDKHKIFVSMNEYGDFERKAYLWNGVKYCEVGTKLGETDYTAFRGDHGKIAYEHTKDGDSHVTPDDKLRWENLTSVAVQPNEPTDENVVIWIDTDEDAVITDIEERVFDLENGKVDKQDYIEERKSDQLKIAKVEKELNDYQKTLSQVNVNQEAKQKVTGYGTVSLPPNCANGQVSVSVKGRTLNNFVQNSNEEKSLTNDSNKHKTDLTFGVDGNKYLITADVFRSTGETVGLRWQDTAGINFGTLVDNQWIRVGYIGIYSKSAIRQMFGFYSTSTNSKLKNQMCIDITGETETDINKLLQKYNYISTGTKSTICAKRFKAVNKNIIDLENDYEIGWIDANTGGNQVYADRTRSKKYYHILKPQLSYSRKGADGGYWAFYYDSNYNFISAVNVGSTPTHEVPANAIYMRWAYSRPYELVKAYEIQIEYNTTQSPYEPYTESTQYITAKDDEGKIVELRSLPNGVKDEIRVSEGKFIKRVSDKIYLKNLPITMHSGVNTTNFWGISVTLPQTTFIEQILLYNYNGKSFSAYSGGIVEYDGYSYRIVSTGSETIYIKIPKSEIVGDIDTIKAKTWFEQNQVALTYQLAEPIITPIEVSGTLLSNPSGTIYVENVVADAGLYTDKMTILHNDLPIASIEKVSKVDFTTGIETELDVSKCVIAEDKLSFTHSDLVSGDIIFFTYYHSLEGTLGETEIEYYDSRHTLKDDVTGKFYKVVPKISDGVLTNELVEV